MASKAARSLVLLACCSALMVSSALAFAPPSLAIMQQRLMLQREQQKPQSMKDGTSSSRSHLLNLNAKVGYTYDIFNFTQPLDHFNFENSDRSFQMRYLINDQYWRKPAPGVTAGPIFFYTGNEGPITLFADNTGFMWDIAPEFEALLVFAEHRYYGASMPFGEDTYKDPKNLQWLTSEQALADFAQFLTWLKADKNALDSPVISFGGSYGGMLTAWFRIKYPHIVAGGIASSAPIWQFTGLTPDYVYNQIVSRDFQNADPTGTCARSIRASWQMMTYFSNLPDGLVFLTETFKPCTPFNESIQVTGDLFAYIANAFSYMAMVDYPYNATFLGPMPGYPVTQACTYFSTATTDHEIVQAVAAATNVFYNWSGQAGACAVISSTGPSTLADEGGWNYQSCTEMVMPIGQDGVHDIFYPAPWNLTAIMEGCQATYHVTPRPFWIETYYGGRHNIRDSTNIVFTNGDLDPWSGGGVLQTLAPSLVSISITGGAHHLDLRASRPQDDIPSVVAARQQQKQWIKQWIQEATSGGGNESPCPKDTDSWKQPVTLAGAILGTLLVSLLGFTVYNNQCRGKRSDDALATNEVQYGALESSRAEVF